MPGVTLVLGTDTLAIQTNGAAAIAPQTVRFTRIECDGIRCSTDSATMGGDIQRDFDGTMSFSLGTITDGPSPIQTARWRHAP